MEELDEFDTALRTALLNELAIMEPRLPEGTAQQEQIQEQPANTGANEDVSEDIQQAPLQTGADAQHLPFFRQYQGHLQRARENVDRRVREHLARSFVHTGPENTSQSAFGGDQGSMSHPLRGDMPPGSDPMSRHLTPHPGYMAPPHPLGGFMIPPPLRSTMTPPPRPMGPLPQLPVARTGYRAVNPIPMPVIAPPTSQVPLDPLFYNSAADADIAQQARNLQWPPRTNGPSFPHTDAQRVQYVQHLVTAMKDMSVASDVPSNSTFKKRWLDPQAQGTYGYPLRSFELACWGIIKATEDLYTLGLTCFNIYDQGTLDKALKEKDLTFEERISVMCDFLRFSKGRVDLLMKGDGLETFVAVTRGKLKELRESKQSQMRSGAGGQQQQGQQQLPTQTSQAPRSTPQQTTQQMPQQQPSWQQQQATGQPPPNPTAAPGVAPSFQQQIFRGQVPQWYYGIPPSGMHRGPNQPVQHRPVPAEEWEAGIAELPAAPSAERTHGDAELSDDE